MGGWRVAHRCSLSPWNHRPGATPRAPCTKLQRRVGGGGAWSERSRGWNAGKCALCGAMRRRGSSERCLGGWRPRYQLATLPGAREVMQHLRLHNPPTPPNARQMGATLEFHSLPLTAPPAPACEVCWEPTPGSPAWGNPPTAPPISVAINIKDHPLSPTWALLAQSSSVPPPPRAWPPFLPYPVHQETAGYAQ